VAGAAALAGCGGGHPKPIAVTTTAPVTTAAPEPDPAAAMRALARQEPTLAGATRTLYKGGDWAVVQSTEGDHASAVAFHLVDGRWHADTHGQVKLEILGPRPGSAQPSQPQVAIGLKSATPLQESALWVDGVELFEKGGGTPTNGTIYGAPDKNLEPGVHYAVGYARNATSGSAVAWTFKTGG
jgi:hypothetical protein